MSTKDTSINNSSYLAMEDIQHFPWGQKFQRLIWNWFSLFWLPQQTFPAFAYWKSTLLLCLSSWYKVFTVQGLCNHGYVTPVWGMDVQWRLPFSLLLVMVHFEMFAAGRAHPWKPHTNYRHVLQRAPLSLYMEMCFSCRRKDKASPSPWSTAACLYL